MKREKIFDQQIRVQLTSFQCHHRILHQHFILKYFHRTIRMIFIIRLLIINTDHFHRDFLVKWQWRVVQLVMQHFFPVGHFSRTSSRRFHQIDNCFQLQRVRTMDSVHLAHLIIVLVQVIRLVCKQIFLQVNRKKRSFFSSFFINSFRLDSMKNMSGYGSTSHLWYSPMLP